MAQTLAQQAVSRPKIAQQAITKASLKAQADQPLSDAR
jgi:hypothetical protein